MLEYDDVLNHHRIAIYSRRNKILEHDNVHEEVENIISEQIDGFIDANIEEERLDRLHDADTIRENINNFA